MSSKDILLTCIWTADDFVVVDNKNIPAQDEAYLKISESDSKITVQIPKGLSLINKKIIERRVQSIAKSGFAIPNTGLRIGGGFEIVLTLHEDIPSVLLQEGHKYSYDEFSPQKVVTKAVEKTTISPEREYIPSFLKHEVRETDYPKKLVREDDKPPLEIIRESEETTSEIPPLPEQELDLPKHGISEVLAGRFIIALSECGDIFFNKNGSNYTVDFSYGKVEFSIDNGKIVILQTERISENDKTIQLAIEAATKEL